MRRPSGARLLIQEVALRDGLQIEPAFVPTERKIELVDRLTAAGLAKIEVTSFVSPKAVPALADGEAVMHGIRRSDDVVYAALVPNVRGAERALACGTDELNLVMSASKGHSLANLRMTPKQSLAVFADIVRAAGGSGVALNASLSTAFGCPFDGPVSTERVLELADRIEAIGIDGLSLCDTTGVANPAQVHELFTAVLARFPRMRITAHFHDTRGMGLANALAALDAGVERFDASLGGLGGCPFAPGASGNVCTEDLVHMFDAMGYNTGVSLDRLLAASADLPMLVHHDVPGQVVRAGKSTRRYALPDSVRA